MTMVEKIARAIYATTPNVNLVWRRGTDVNDTRWQESIPETWEDAPDRHEMCRQQARAALEAMREPPPSARGKHFTGPAAADILWTAMLNAALNEKDER